VIPEQLLGGSDESSLVSREDFLRNLRGRRFDGQRKSSAGSVPAGTCQANSEKFSISSGSHSFSSGIERVPPEKVAVPAVIVAVKAGNESISFVPDSRSDENESMQAFASTIPEENVAGKDEHGSFPHENDAGTDEKVEEPEEKEPQQEEIVQVIDENEKETKENVSMTDEIAVLDRTSLTLLLEMLSGDDGRSLGSCPQIL
jgi:hypothetical protein